MRFDRKQLLLYGVTDRSWLNGQTLYEQVRQALEGGVSFLTASREKSFGAGIFRGGKKRYKNCAGSTRCRLSLMTTWILHWRLMRTVCMSDRMIWRRGKCEKDLERIRSSEFRHTRWRKRCALKNAGRLTLAPVLCLEAARKKDVEDVRS